MTRIYSYTIPCPDEPPVIPAGFEFHRYTVSTEGSNQTWYKQSWLWIARMRWVEFGYQRQNLRAQIIRETEAGELMAECEWKPNEAQWGAWWDYYTGKEIEDFEAWVRTSGEWAEKEEDEVQ